MADVQYEARGAIAVLHYANGPHGAMNSPGANALIAALKRALSDANIHAVIITGARDVFVRHYDVDELIDVAGALADGQITTKQFDHAPFFDLADQIAASPKPAIAAINGACLGAGFELALACDLRIASRGVREIGLPETRLGLFPGGGGTQRLPRLIGVARALDFMLTGRVVDAAEAERFGLVHRVADDALQAAFALGEALAARPAGGLAAAKRLTRQAFDHPLPASLIAERRAFAELLKTDAGALAQMRRFVAAGAQIGELP
ncbi:MAG: enoyl-CoA hydratase/isomerase family protein [Hyphomonadaceae bacterium]